MKKVLFATDYSDVAPTVFNTACFLASTLKAELHAVHVFEIAPSFKSTLGLSYIEKEQKLLKDNKTRIEKFCDPEVLGSFQLENCKTHIIEEQIASDGILKVADDINADYIVVGMQQANRLREVVLGSTVSSLIKKSVYPLIILPEDFDAEKLRSFVYATDFEEADLVAVEAVVELAETLQIPIQLVHISTEREYSGQQQLEWFKEMLKERVAYSDISFELILSNDITKALLSYLDHTSHSMLVMLERRKNNVLSGFWQMDLVEKVKAEKSFPLLSFKKDSLKKLGT